MRVQAAALIRSKLHTKQVSVVMAYVVMAYVAMACIGMAEIVMTYVVMAYITNRNRIPSSISVASPFSSMQRMTLAIFAEYHQAHVPPIPYGSRSFMSGWYAAGITADGRSSDRSSADLWLCLWCTSTHASEHLDTYIDAVDFSACIAVHSHEPRRS